MTLSVGPAATPGLPPEEPAKVRKLLDRFLSLSTAATVLVVFGVLFLLSLVFATQASKTLIGFAYLYQLLAEFLGGLI